ncbi:MAG: EipA family protein [Pseudomonadota bacterium]
MAVCPLFNGKLILLLVLALVGGTITACAKRAPEPASVSDPTGVAPDDTAAASGADEETYDQERLVEAAERAFGKGAEGIARGIEKVFSKLGRPNGYIIGEEAGGGFLAALRYGSGKLHHKIEGERDIFWTGPSVGLDIGANAAKTFTLVYNLYDTEDMFHRFPAVEGQVFVVGGVGVNYHQRGRVIIAPIRLGVGFRAGANVGYLKYSRSRNLNPL